MALREPKYLVTGRIKTNEADGCQGRWSRVGRRPSANVGAVRHSARRRPSRRRPQERATTKNEAEQSTTAPEQTRRRAGAERAAGPQGRKTRAADRQGRRTHQQGGRSGRSGRSGRGAAARRGPGPARPGQLRPGPARPGRPAERGSAGRGSAVGVLARRPSWRRLARRAARGVQDWQRRAASVAASVANVRARRLPAILVRPGDLGGSSAPAVAPRHDSRDRCRARRAQMAGADRDLALAVSSTRAAERRAARLALPHRGRLTRGMAP